MTDAAGFARRFEFALVRGRITGAWTEEADLAGLLGVSASRLSEYKGRDEAPRAKWTLALAEACGVDPGWLAFGADSEAPAPDGFADWLARRYPTLARREKTAPHDNIKVGDVEPRVTPRSRPKTARKRA